jgi:hypothetical protein
MRQLESAAEQALAPVHLAAVRVMIVTGKMKQAMQDEDLDLNKWGVAVLASLAARRVKAYRQVACNALLPGEPRSPRKGQHVRGLINFAKCPVEAPDFGVCR